MNTKHPLFAPILRAVTVVVIGAVALGGITHLVHKPRNPYYAQLAAKAAKDVSQKKTGDQNGFAYIGNDSK